MCHSYQWRCRQEGSMHYTAALLLNKMESQAPQPKQCDFYEDISLLASPATALISIVGAIGAGSAVNEESRNFRAQSHHIKPLKSKMQDGNFCFNNNPAKEDVDIITKYYQQCTYSVKKPEKSPAHALSVKNQGHPGKDGDGDGNGNHGSQDPPTGSPGSSSSQTQQQSKAHSMENNLKQLKQYFGQTKSLNQMSPLKIIFFINFGLFAHSQLTLPFVSPFFPEHSYGQDKPYFSNFKNELSEDLYLSADPKPWPARQTGSTMYSLESTDWPSGPMLDLVQRKKAGMTQQAKPNMPLLKIKNIYELQNLDLLDDPRDLRIFKYNLCDSCEERSKKCAKCKSGAKQSTIEELKEYEMIANSVEVIIVDKQRYLRCNYPVMGDAPVLYHQDLTNRYAALAKGRHH